MQKLIKLIEELLENGDFYISCIELDTNSPNRINGEEFGRDLRAALAEAKTDAAALKSSLTGLLKSTLALTGLDEITEESIQQEIDYRKSQGD